MLTDSTSDDQDDDLMETATALRKAVYGRQPLYRAVPQPSRHLTFPWIPLILSMLLVLLRHRKRA